MPDFGVHCKLLSVIIHRIMHKNDILTFTVPEQYANDRLDQALVKMMPEYSRTQIQTWIEDGLVQLDHQATKAKAKLKGGETITVQVVVKTLPPTLGPENIPLNIVYEDNSLLIVNKPAGLIVHPGAGNPSGTLVNALLYHDPSLNTLPRAGILHRLDKDTSGLLIVAKTASALKDLSKQLKKRSIVREYQAVVYGTLISGGTVDAPIDRHPTQRKRMAVVDMGKEAITHYRVSERFRAHTLLKLRLETGRTHQIRVHLSHLHYPIIGDPVYGGRVILSKQMTPELVQMIRQFKRQALHAYAIELTHPETQSVTRWEAPLPDDMLALLQALRTDSTEAKK